MFFLSLPIGTDDQEMIEAILCGCTTIADHPDEERAVGRGNHVAHFALLFDPYPFRAAVPVKARVVAVPDTAQAIGRYCDRGSSQRDSWSAYRPLEWSTFLRRRE